MSQETSASGWSAWSTEDSEGESSAHKRRRFQLLRREHYDMRQALAKCAGAVSPVGPCVRREMRNLHNMRQARQVRLRRASWQAAWHAVRA